MHLWKKIQAKAGSENRSANNLVLNVMAKYISQEDESVLLPSKDKGSSRLLARV